MGTRLQPLTDTIPKPLLPLAGQPLIVWNLLLLRQHGISDVIMNLYHLGHVIERELGDGSQFGMRFSYSRETVPLETGGGVKQVEAFFEGEPFVVLNGDTLVDLDLRDMVDRHRARGGLATMALRDDPHVEKWGVVETDTEDRVWAIRGRGWSPDRPKPPLFRRMFAGVHVMHPLLLRDIPKGQAFSIIDAYVAWLEQGAEVYGYMISGYWSDVGTPERYAQAQQDAEAGTIQLSSRLADCSSAD